MKLLKKAENTTAYVKAGFLGFGGSGKTLTAALLALGLSKEFGKHKAVAMFDTETGSDFLIPIFEREGINFYVHKGRALADLLAAFKEAAGNVDALITDSVTHVWKEVMSAFERKLNRKYGLLMRDWGPIKEEWGAFTDAYVNAPFHAIICGRAGFEWDEEKDEGGKTQLVKTGVKMKAEGEMGYEPSLLVEMQRVPKSEELTNDPETHGWLNRAIVLKDRSQQLHGAMVNFGSKPGEQVRYQPVLDFVKPHLAYLNIGGKHLGVDTSRTSDGLFESPESRVERGKKVRIILDLIPDAFVEAGLGGSSEKAKQSKLRCLKAAFGTSSWTAIENMRLEDLESGYQKLGAEIAREAAEPAGAK